MLNTDQIRSANQSSSFIRSHREHFAAAVLRNATGTVSIQLTNGNVITGTVDPAGATIHNDTPCGFVVVTDDDNVAWVVNLNEIVAVGQ